MALKLHYKLDSAFALNGGNMTQVSGLEIIKKYNWQVPRYTSYPPSPYFTQSPSEVKTISMIKESNQIGPKPISLYFHIPFCPKRCLFCGCHTEIGRPGNFIRNYMEVLARELDLLLPLFNGNRPITQVHFGGGTPNTVPYFYLKELIGTLKSTMGLSSESEIAIECDPNLLTLSKIEELSKIGYNRLSIGIQDFDVKVLAAVNRRFPKVAPKEIFNTARNNGFKGNNLDLIYGLPYQTPSTFALAIEKTIDSDPDRISLFPYAHVPWVKDHQTQLQKLPMPGIEERLEIAWESRESLVKAGYVPIGMDHFAKPQDELAIAARSGGLHRNFQGYCTAARAGQVYALGASAISQLQNGYIQNAKDLETYVALVKSGNLSHEVAYRMSPQNLAVRNIINGILCEGKSNLELYLTQQEISDSWKTDYLKFCKMNLKPLIEDDLVILDGNTVLLTENGHFASRAVASTMDPMIKSKIPEGQPRYSQAL
jgi:oxygen-independent coproporphyrinogen III oxidase